MKKKNRTLFNRIPRKYTTPALIFLFAAIAFISYRFISVLSSHDDEVREDILSSIEDSANNLISDISDLIEYMESDASDDILKRQPSIDWLVQTNEAIEYVVFQDRDGDFMILSDRLPSQTDETPLKYDDEVMGFKDNLRRSMTYSLSGEPASYFDIAVPIRLADGEAGVLRIGVRKEKIREAVVQRRGKFIRNIAVGIGLSLILVASGSFYISRLARKNRSLEEKIRKRERLAYIGTLAGGLAHEIKNPLGPIKANVQLLEEDFTDGEYRIPDDSFEMLKSVRNEVSRLENLVNQFLLFAKPGRIQKTPCVVEELLNEVIELTSLELKKNNIRISRKFDETSEIYADRALLKQLFLNLILNARDAMKETGGTLTAETERDDGFLIIRIKDSGVGIPEEDQKHIFEAFYSTKNGGTGLGLSIARRIVSEHEGFIELKSRLNEGSCFSVHLPLIRTRESSPSNEELMKKPAGDTK